MDTDFVKNILKNKNDANDYINRFAITPEIDDYGWYDAIYEARECGIPHASFGDTSDKKVITPYHLGYTHFEYHWSHSWTSQPCWVDADADEVIKANKELIEFATILNHNGYKVYIVHPSGCGKGYLSTRLYTIESYNDDDDEWKYESDLVLFVYGI